MIFRKEKSKMVSRKEKLLTTSRVAEILHIHENTVRRWSDSGLLKTYRIGTRRDRRFKRNDIENFLRSS
jgi:excisionase family DNA binding protein